MNNTLNPAYSLYSLTITPTTPGATVTSTSVNWGDGTIDSNTTHRYATKGSKTISVTITDSNGTTANATKTILVTPGIVISQFYTAGANSATYRADFVELFNASDISISVSGWSLQYAAATGAFGAGVGSIANLTAVSIPAGGYYLIRMEANAGGGGAGLNITDPVTVSAANRADAVMTIGMSNGTGGKIALSVNTTAIPCGTALCTAAQLVNVVDLVGYGPSATVNNFETARTTAAGTAANSVKRAGNGCTDTDNNSSDFSTTLTAVTNPLRNTATTAVPCF